MVSVQGVSTSTTKCNTHESLEAAGQLIQHAHHVVAVHSHAAMSALLPSDWMPLVADRLAAVAGPTVVMASASLAGRAGSSRPCGDARGLVADGLAGLFGIVGGAAQRYRAVGQQGPVRAGAPVRHADHGRDGERSRGVPGATGGECLVKPRRFWVGTRPAVTDVDPLGLGSPIGRCGC